MKINSEGPNVADLMEIYVYTLLNGTGDTNEPV